VSLTKPYKLSWAEDTKEKKEKMARIINLVFILKKKLNKNKGLILGSYKFISSVIFPAQALSYRFNGYNLSPF
jgi:hypothetical protein